MTSRKMIADTLKLANGNPGAMSFIMDLFTNHEIFVDTILKKLESTGIKGTDLYVLWSDLCDRDMSKVLKLCKNCPDNILIDACSRQDYSGRELVKKYL